MTDPLPIDLPDEYEAEADPTKGLAWAFWIGTPLGVVVAFTTVALMAIF